MCTTYGDPFREIDSARAASLNFPGAKGAKGPGIGSDGGMELEAHEDEYMVFEIWIGYYKWHDVSQEVDRNN